MIDSSQKWIEAGYELFATEGPEGVIVEKLARRLGLNKSGLYHHFGDREVFLSKLMEHHNRIGGQFSKEALLLKRFYPDYLDLLFKYKTSVFVQMHLRRHMEIPVFHEEFLRVAKRNDKAMLPLWAEYIKLQGNHELAFNLWDVLRDLFFVRAKIESLTPETLYLIVDEFSGILKTYGKHVAKEGGLLNECKGT